MAIIPARHESSRSAGVIPKAEIVGNRARVLPLRWKVWTSSRDFSPPCLRELHPLLQKVRSPPTSNSCNGISVSCKPTASSFRSPRTYNSCNGISVSWKPTASSFNARRHHF